MTEGPIQLYSEEVDFEYADSNTLFQWIEKVIREEKHLLGHINIIFASDEYVLRLNKDYLNHDYYTDILTFQYEKEPIEGDLFISVDRIQENAKHLEVHFDDELNRVIIHGILHLMGYEDKSVGDVNIMRGKEDYYLKMKNRPNDLS